MKLTHRTILITGGSTGIGLAFALQFAGLGNTVIVTGRRQAVLDRISVKYPELHTVRSDVASPTDVAALATKMKRDFPQLDVLVNNAGISRYRNLKSSSADLEELMEEVNINVGGVVRMTSAFMDILTANKGTLINVSSGLAFAPLPCLPIYCATKAAIHSYTQSLRFQLEESGMEIIEIMPPAVKTDMTKDISDDDGITLITAEQLVTLSIASLRKGLLEIHPGQSRQLAFMRRLAPEFINRQLWKAARKFVPVHHAGLT